MLILGIETSIRPGSVALCDDDSCLLQLPLEQPNRRHAQMLATQVQQLFLKTGKRVQDCDLIAVSLGPGSFTGLRVGVVFAKTFAYALECEVIGIDTFAAIASATQLAGTEITVIANAYRQELFVGAYLKQPPQDQQGPVDWIRSGDIKIEPVDNWLNTRERGALMTGPGLDLFDAFPADCQFEMEPHRHPQAGSIARVGFREYSSRGADDQWQLQPVYLRRSAAEEKWDAKIASCDPNQ